MGIIQEDLLNLHGSTMKSFFALALVCLASTVRAEITCDDCQVFGGNMQAYLMSEESIAEQTELLVALLCPQLDDPAGCETGIRTWWAGIGAAMYPVFLEPGAVCGELGACKVKSLVSEPTCDECIEGVMAVGSIIASDAKIAAIVEFLKGDDFCGTTPDLAGCGAYIDVTIPAAMPILGGVLVERSPEYCCTLSPSGVCC